MKTLKRFFATLLTMVLMASLPIQAKAAEVVQMETVQLVQDGYYQEVERDGVFQRHDAEGNLLSSIKVEDALFKVNSTLTEGWGKATIDGSHTEGTFKNATLDKKGYFHCTFTTEANVVYDKVVVKVVVQSYEKWASENEAKAAADKAAASLSTSGNGDGNTSGNGDGNTSGNGDGNTSGNGGGSSSGNGGGSSSDKNPGHQGWTDAVTPTQSGDTNPGHQGWTDALTSVLSGDTNPGHQGWTS